MAFWSKWFSSSATGDESPAKSMEYKGYMIEGRPYKAGGQWQLAGRITREGKTHDFVRADKFTSKDEAAEIAVSKGQLIIDQTGESLFK